MSPLPSIRRRLARTLLTVSLVWGVLVVLLVGLVTRQSVDALLDSTMQEAAEILYALVQPLAQDNDGPIRIMPPSPHDEQLVWQVISAQGRIQARSVMSPTAPLGAGGAAGFSDREMPDGTAWRVFSLRVSDAGSMLHVAQNMSDRSGQQMKVAAVSLGAALLVGLATSIWLSRRVRRELDPLLLFSDAVGRQDPLHAAQLPPATRQELVPMRDAVITLAQRLSRMLDNERAFTAHAAHTLRTPLAGMDAQLAAAMQESPAELQPRLRRAREALARLNRVVVALLHLFRAGRDLHPQAIDLGGLIAHLQFDGLEIAVDQRGPLHADADVLTAALLNLLENSLRHGASRVVVSVRTAEGAALLRVQDDGSGIDDERRKAMQDAIERQDLAGGLGLGLTLANVVSRAHGGRLRLMASDTGVAVEISFPHAEPAATLQRAGR